MVVLGIANRSYPLSDQAGGYPISSASKMTFELNFELVASVVSAWSNYEAIS